MQLLTAFELLQLSLTQVHYLQRDVCTANTQTVAAAAAVRQQP
jgi:hypothetical protein